MGQSMREENENVNRKVEALLDEAAHMLNNPPRVAKEPVVNDSSDDMPASLALKIAQLEASTEELNDDSCGLLEQLQAESADFEASRQRAQQKLEQFKQLDSEETAAAVDKLSS